MFDTTLALFVSWLAQALCLLLTQAWQHPIISTGLCLLLGLYTQADEQVRQQCMDQLRARWQRFNFCAWLPGKVAPSQANYYDYGMQQGPHTWLHVGPNQSPVNIDEQATERLAIRELLNWNHYDELPLSITLENTGQTLLLRAQFRANAPTLSGADLLANYTFMELSFHWGWSNSEGSEHTINHRKYPLEMQVLHRTGAAVPRSSTSSYDLLMVAYVFELSAHNPFLDPLMQNLKLVQQPGKRVQIAPFPLSYLVYPFRTGFYSYGGSLTQPPCYQGTEWFIFPESLAISDFQLRHFRQLLSGDGITPITRNSRPVQSLGNRIINLNYFCPYDATQLARMRLELLQQQELEEQEAQAVQIEQQQQQQQQLKQQQQQQQQQQQPEQLELKSISSDDEGQLIETLDTTTTITTNSNTSVCTTVLKRESLQQQQQQPLPPYCPNSIIFFSSNNFGNTSNSNGSEGGDTNMMEKCSGHGHGHYQLEQTEADVMMTLSNGVGICGMGDGFNVGVGVGVGVGVATGIPLME
ncbi:CG12309 [Drosophila busckii]|uniref:CG12309 n=1 Tax=Drosophila busckii TaxID=30019 RepID=A0A0M5IZ16_DROBS|nr:uncharacterized protein LOC108597017 [Drosophila busckii]ALC40624.1 CG12309 [Drosophila busckii]